MTGRNLEAALDALVEPVMLTDAQGVITYTNAAGARRFGWDKEIGVPLGDRVARAPFVKPDLTRASLDEDPIAVALATRRPVLGYRFAAQTGPGAWASLVANVTPVMQGGTVCVVHEVSTDQVTRLQAMVDQTDDSVFVVGPDGHIMFANAVGEALIGPASQEPGRERARRLDIRYPDGRPLPPAMLPSSLALSGETVSGMGLTIMKEGMRHITAKAHPLRGADGAVYAAVVTLRDVTADVRGREELERAREAAEEANRLKDEFIAALSHELRTPLQPILGWTEVLRRHGRLDDVTSQALEAIRRNIRQQVRLVDDLLDLSRIVHGKFQLRHELFDLREQVKSAAEPFEEAAALRRVRLTLTMPSTPVTMWGDGARLQQIAGNLIANAVKFTPPGGHIAVHLVASDSEALLEVEDTGDGIAPEDLPVIFETFRQGAMSRRRGGLGIGLDLVKRLTEAHDGTVEAFSEGAGYGARFQVRLPLRVPTTPPADQAKPRTRLDGRSILVVEDNADTRHVLKFMLEIEGAQVEAAESGHDAVLRADALRPHIVLCDIGLPDMDGLEVARRLRAASWAAHTLLIALTGYGQPEDIRHALEAGFDAHLTKPINLDQLLSLIGDFETG